MCSFQVVLTKLIFYFQVRKLTDWPGSVAWDFTERLSKKTSTWAAYFNTWQRIMSTNSGKNNLSRFGVFILSIHFGAKMFGVHLRWFRLVCQKICYVDYPIIEDPQLLFFKILAPYPHLLASPYLSFFKILHPIHIYFILFVLFDRRE